MTNRSHVASMTCASVALLAVTLGWEGVAQAEPTLGVRVEVAPSLSDSAKTGVGGHLRFGYQIELPVLFIVPEVGLAYHRFTASAAPDVSIATPFAGARVGFGSFVRPYVDAHVGAAHRAYDPTTPADGWSPYFDVGGGLGIRPLRYVEVGGHVNLQLHPKTNTQPQLNALGLGIEANVYF